MTTDTDIFLAHYGVKGMKWGVRKQASADRKAGRKELRQVSKDARSAMKASRKAKTREEAKAASDKYKKDVYNKVRSPEYKKAYQDAHTMGVGEMLLNVALAGPLAAVTIPAAKSQYKTAREYGTELDKGASTVQLAKLRATEKTKPKGG